LSRLQEQLTLANGNKTGLGRSECKIEMPINGAQSQDDAHGPGTIARETNV
jgi:hypothetical protein